MKYIFLDTNVFFHFKDFEQIPWGELVDDTDFKIVVSDIVEGEIDKNKDSARGKVQKRAKLVSSKLGDAFLDEKKLSVDIDFCQSCPSKLSEEQKARFNPQSQDDQILMCILASCYPKDEIVLVSHDNTMLIKAKANGLLYLRMPELYKIKEELSAEEKELESYKKELAELKNRLPKPILALNGEKTILSLKKTPPFKVEECVNEHMEEIKIKYPHIGKPNENKNASLSNFSKAALVLSDEYNIRMYNTYLDAYYKTEEKYWRVVVTKNALESRMEELSFVLINEGTAETGNVDIFIEIPAEVKLYTDDCKKHFKMEIPSTPTPYKPFSSIYLNDAFKSNSQILYDCVDVWNLENPVQHPSIHYSTSSVNHSLCRTLSVDSVYYIDKETCGNFSIKYRIVDSKISRPIEGEIHVVIKEKE